MPTSRPIQTSDKLGDILDYPTDIEDLKDEMEEWRDNIPDSLQSSDKYTQVDEAAETLGSAASELKEACGGIKRLLEMLPKDESGSSLLDRARKLSGGETKVNPLDMTISYTEHKMYKGYQMPRWVRLANPCAAIQAVIDFIEDLIENISKDLARENTSAEDYAEELKSYIKQIEDALGDLDNVEFPSMFG